MCEQCSANISARAPEVSAPEVKYKSEAKYQAPARMKSVGECLSELEGDVRTIVENDRRPGAQAEALSLPSGSLLVGQAKKQTTADLLEEDRLAAARKNKDGSLTPLEKCKVILNIYDADEDGYLNFSEAQQWEADLGAHLDQEEYNALCFKMKVPVSRGLGERDILRIYDGNESHLTSDYETVMKKSLMRNQKRKVEAIHRFFDNDGDGFLNLEEMKALCKARADALKKDEFVALCVAFGSRQTASAGLGPQALLKIYKELGDEELDSDYCETQRHRRPSVDAGAWRLAARKRRLVEVLQSKLSSASSSSSR